MQLLLVFHVAPMYEVTRGFMMPGHVVATLIVFGWFLSPTVGIFIGQVFKLSRP